MLLDPSVISELRDVALAAARASAPVTSQYFRNADLAIENKEADGFDPVTLADKAAEQAIRKVLRDLRPDDAILGEEFQTESGTTGLTWVIDPIDGTRGFISGTPNWGTLISVGDENGPILGLIDQPYIGETFLGGPGFAELIRGDARRQMQTRRVADLSQATIFTTFPEIGTEVEARAFHAVARQTKLTRYGMDCYAYGLLAAGQIDLVIETGLQTYDIHAPIAVIQAAGGIVTDWEGQPAHMGGRVVAAGSTELHQLALDALHKTD